MKGAVHRRSFITLLGGAAAAWPMAARAQGRFWRVGVLFLDTQALTPDHEIASLVQSLHDLGYVEGRNIIFDWRFADGSLERLAAHAATLARLNVDVIVAWSGLPIRAAQLATRTIPIVMVSTTDPVGSGFAQSLARPGGNITGSSGISADFSPKQLELIREVMPKLTRVAVLGRKDGAGIGPVVRSVQDAARPVGIAVVQVEVGADPSESVEKAFAVIAREGADAIIFAASPSILAQRRQAAELAIKHTVATIAGDREYAAAGFLMSYGPGRSEDVKRAAIYVDRILKGTKPADLPIVQPARFPLVINLKTAKALGLDVPPTLLARADEVIE